MRADLGGSYADLQWITAAYTLAMAVGLLTGGRLGDMFGRKRMLLIGAGRLHDRLGAVRGGAVGRVPDRLARAPGRRRRRHAAAGLRPDPRPVPGRPDGQGVGRARARSSGLSAVLGPIVAGLLIDADIARHRLALDLPRQRAGRRLRDRRRRPLPARRRAGRAPAAARRDAASSLAGAGAVLLVYPLVQGRELGWPVWILGCWPPRCRCSARSPATRSGASARARPRWSSRACSATARTSPARASRWCSWARWAA